jgi:hypothetical protein
VKWIRRNLSFANVISVIALFVALGGASYAAVTLPKNSVGAAQIKKNAVRAAEVRKNAVGASEIKGSAVASGDVRDNSLTGGDVLDGSLGTADLADGSVSSAKVADGSLARGDLSDAAAGPRAFARVDATGALIGGETQSKGITAAMIQHEDTPATTDPETTTGPGIYCFGGLGFEPRSVTVATDNTDSLPAVPTLTGGSLNFISTAAVFKGEDFGRCNSTHGQVRVAIEQVNDAAAPTLANHGFFIWIEG